MAKCDCRGCTMSRDPRQGYQPCSKPKSKTIHDLRGDEEQALERLKGCAVKSISHHDSLGLLEVHFENGASLSVQAHGRCDTSVMTIEPKEGAPC